MKIEKNIYIYSLSILFSPHLRRNKASNFNSLGHNAAQDRRLGDSRAVTSIQECLVSRFLYSSVVFF